MTRDVQHNIETYRCFSRIAACINKTVTYLARKADESYNGTCCQVITNSDLQLNLSHFKYSYVINKIVTILVWAIFDEKIDILAKQATPQK